MPKEGGVEVGLISQMGKSDVTGIETEGACYEDDKNRGEPAAVEGNEGQH